MPGPYSLPSLPYAYNALEPHISGQIMELHHSRHHAAYVANLNKAMTEAEGPNTRSLIHFNGGGHINHSIFWKNLAPAASTETKTTAAPSLVAGIAESFGSFADFKAKFNAKLLGIQGSGWGWLVVRDGSKLDIVTTRDQDTVAAGTTAIFGIDMWEHAYYLQYLNGKTAYVENIWNVINWAYAESRFMGAADGEFKELKALL